MGRSFAPAAVPFMTRTRTTKNFHITTSTTTRNNGPLFFFGGRRGGLADPEQGEDLNRREKSSSSDNINPASSWTQVAGGFLPNLPRGATGVVDSPSRANSAYSPPSVLIRDVTTLADYKKIVVDGTATFTVVRFYAPWCRACQANQPLYQKLAAAYRNRSTSSSDGPYQKNPVIQFVQVPLTQETAVLQQGLGIPSLPYGHIYHAEAGLVEERKIGKKTFGTFEQVLQTYVQGYCDVTYDEENNNNSDNNDSPPLLP
jgi:thiol-disulfide isomerase/thioredoxin